MTAQAPAAIPTLGPAYPFHFPPPPYTYFGPPTIAYPPLSCMAPCCAVAYTPCFCPYPSLAYGPHSPYHLPQYPAPAYPHYPTTEGYSEEEEDVEEDEQDGGMNVEEYEEVMEQAEVAEGGEVEEEEEAPFYVLSEEAIALFARSEERRRKEKNRVQLASVLAHIPLFTLIVA
jgi:hypothetical protein